MTTVSATRVGDWIQTASKRKFWPLDPRPEDIYLYDIAHALSNVTRFAGHCTEFYSVAQHSIYVADMVEALYGDKNLSLWGLLHDAAEAYIGDMPRPLKHSDDWAAPFREAEDRLEKAVAERFMLTPDLHPVEVERADRALLVTEMRDIMGGPNLDRVLKGYGGVRPLPFKIRPWSPGEAKERFFDKYEELRG